MNRRRAPGAVEERIGEGVVHVFRGGREARGDESDKRDSQLERQTTVIVAEPVQGPEQQHRQGKMKEREQADPERMARIEKIFGSADEMMPEKDLPAGIERPRRVDEQR